MEILTACTLLYGYSTDVASSSAIEGLLSILILICSSVILPVQMSSELAFVKMRNEISREKVFFSNYLLSTTASGTKHWLQKQ